MNPIKVFCLFLAIIGSSECAQQACNPTPSTASGTKAPKGPFCSGQLLLDEKFNSFDRNLWQHEVTLGGGGNGEFQWYTDDAKNSFVQNSRLWITPTLTSDVIGEKGLENATVDLGAKCTNSMWNGCKRTGTSNNVINPIRSARLRTLGSFQYKYGRLQVVAKMPTGDWLWPAIWLLPSNEAYGTWPRSGELDLVESRGNRNYSAWGGQIGVEQIGSTLHFGPSPDDNGFSSASFQKNAPGNGFNKGFHTYEMLWTPDQIQFTVDSQEIGTVVIGSGFYSRFTFRGTNPWTSGTKTAPFDQEFHLLINLAVGGTSGFFPDVSGKPWSNSMSNAMTAFWRGRNQWKPTWNFNSFDPLSSSLVVESIRVWAL